MNQKLSGSRLIWWLLLVVLIVNAAAFLYLASQPFAVWQSLGSSLAPDGDLEVLTPGLFQVLHKVVLVAGIIFIVLAAGMAVKPAASLELLQRMGRSIQSLFRRFPADWRAFFRQLGGWPPEHLDRWILLTLIVLSVLARAALLERPMLHDESYTVEAWAAGSVRTMLEDYHLPNNHIFHTLLVSIFIKTFGVLPWIVRLPAFSGIALLIPAGYGLGRRWYGRGAGLLGAGLIAFAPVFSMYSSNARGYPLYMLFTVLLFWLAARLLRNNNLLEWMLWIIIGALGFWTVPMMLYPFGAVCVWILLAAMFDRQAKQAYSSPLRLIKYLVTGGILTVLLVFLAYLPVLYHSGTRFLFNNSFIEPLSYAEFWPTLFESRLPETWQEFTLGLGGVLPWLLAIGIVLSLVLHRRISAYPIHALAALAIWVIPLLVLRRPNGWARVWSYLYPLGIIWAAAGWAGFVRLISTRLPDLTRRGKWLAPLGMTLISVWVLVLGLRWNLQTCPGFNCPTGNEELAVEFLAPQLTDSDLILVKSPSDSSIWFYFRQNGLSSNYFQKDRPFDRVILVVQPDTEETVDSLLDNYNLNHAWFDPSSLRRLTNIGRLDIYEMKVLPGVNTQTGEVN
ncbi:MAG TPA: glycosyltransferase family 39 protein [Bellilinea sp.]|nr:glycosyltransferase family 39 protein [Bellilinea sp.]